MRSPRDFIASLLPRSAFNRAASLLVGGTAIAQLATVAASPVLTRLYAPADFGTLAVYTSIIGIVGGLASLSYHQAIPMPESDDEAASILGLSMFCTVTGGAVAAIGMMVAGQRIAARLDASGLIPYMWMVPLGVVALSTNEILVQWAVRKKNFSGIAGTTVFRGFAQIGTQLGMGMIGVAPFGLLLGQFIGQGAGSSSLLRAAWMRDRAAIAAMTPATLRAAALRYQDFPKYSAPAGLLNSLSVEAPPLLLSYFFGGTVTGFYALGARVLMMPVSLIAKSASQVFFATAAGAIRTGKLGDETGALFGRMVRMAAPVTLLLFVAAPDLFAVVFGAQWREAGVYAQWLLPWVGIVFLAFPLMPLISVCNRQRAGMAWQAGLLVGRLGALVLGGWFGDPKLAIALFGIGSGLFWAFYTGWLLRLGGAPLRPAARDMMRPTAEGVVWCLPMIVGQAAGVASPIIVAAFAVTAALALYRLVRAQPRN